MPNTTHLIKLIDLSVSKPLKNHFKLKFGEFYRGQKAFISKTGYYNQMPR
jgi:hypothetical protein